MSEISENFGRSRWEIVEYFKKKNRSGTTAQIRRAVRAIVNVARTPGMTARKATIANGVNESLRAVQRALAAHDRMEYCHLKKRTKLEARNIKLRFDRAKNFSWCEPEESRRTIFTGEKRFCLDGPDVSAYYWDEKSLSKANFYKRINGGGILMV